MTRFTLLAPVLGLLACGPRPPGTQSNQTYFWKVLSSDLVYGICADDPAFRMGLAPLKFEANSYLIYKASKDNKTAVTQTCDRLDPATCMPSTSKVVFTIGGTELAFSSSAKSPVGLDGCQLLDTTTWLLTDKGMTGTLEITHVLSLVDNPTACDAADKQIKSQSPNMLGLEGCVVTFKVGLSQ